MKKTKPKKNETKASKELQAAFDRFPALLKAKEKAAKERARIMKNFLSVKDKVYKG